MEYVYFKPSLNLAHMTKEGRYRVTKTYADSLVKSGYGEIDGDAPGAVESGVPPDTWTLDTPPADYIERYQERYEAGEVSAAVKERFELAQRLVSLEE